MAITAARSLKQLFLTGRSGSSNGAARKRERSVALFYVSIRTFLMMWVTWRQVCAVRPCCSPPTLIYIYEEREREVAQQHLLHGRRWWLALMQLATLFRTAPPLTLKREEKEEKRKERTRLSFWYKEIWCVCVAGWAIDADCCLTPGIALFNMEHNDPVCCYSF